jgi:hypothetical protein
VAGLALWLVAILWGRTLYFGHPEEPLAAALALAAVAAAGTRRPLLAGVLLGLAIGTKEWALLVAPAVLLAGVGHEWRRALAGCAAAVVITVGGMAAGSPSAFRAAHDARRAGDVNAMTPASLWFRTGHRHVVAEGNGLVAYEVYPPRLIGRWCRPFVFALACAATLLFWRRRGWDDAAVLALAGFLLVARSVFDTQTFSYHLVPMLMFVTAWELLGRRRFPLVGAAVMLAFQLTARTVSSSLSADTFNAIYLAWTLPLLALLGFAALRRPRLSAARPAGGR